MRALISLFTIVILINSICLPANARPGEPINKVLKRYDLEGQKPFTQEGYVAYKLNDKKYISQPTLFLKLGAKGVILEQNFLFDKNTIHEKDVQRSKSDSKPEVSIPHQAYLIGDFSQLPREDYELWDRVIGGITAPFGAAAGSIVGAGKGTYHGTRLGFNNAGSAGRALGGDASGKVAAVAGSASAIAAGAVTGLFAGIAGGAVEGASRGARVGINGITGADRNIDGEVAVASTHSIVGGRIGKELSLEEQKDLLNRLAKLEQSRLAGGNLPDDLAQAAPPLPDTDSDTDKVESYLDDFDTAKANNDFDNSPDYLPEDGSGKNVAGMW